MKLCMCIGHLESSVQNIIFFMNGPIVGKLCESKSRHKIQKSKFHGLLMFGCGGVCWFTTFAMDSRHAKREFWWKLAETTI